ncbi:hypothetical protein [Candidatus Albibeggiatoa sp. nov. BB20]|uniref:hypothetical protein n=1 Tax=Candidatus Albibeggiatoa sp. nov. BB20 TaxID=3162723 RepID=UPI00336531DF
MIERLKKLWRNFRRTILISLGLLIFLIGLITFPLPLPMGLPLLTVSSIILLRNSSRARLSFRRLKKWAATHSKPQVIHGFLKKIEAMVYTQKINLLKKKRGFIEEVKEVDL